MSTLTTRAALSLSALGVLALASGGCRGNKTASPPVHLNQNMDFQQKFLPQEKNDWFADGRAMRPPVEGTVARGHLREDVHLYTGKNDAGEFVDALPKGMQLDDALLARGEERYAIYCVACHDAVGNGQGVVIQRGFKVPPPTYHQDRLQQSPLGYFFDVMTHGKGTMLSYAAQVPVNDRWAIAAWIRTLQVSQRAAKADVPAGALNAPKSPKSGGGAQ